MAGSGLFLWVQNVFNKQLFDLFAQKENKEEKNFK